jgi:hypothetical protein
MTDIVTVDMTVTVTSDVTNRVTSHVTHSNTFRSHELFHSHMVQGFGFHNLGS